MKYIDVCEYRMQVELSSISTHQPVSFVSLGWESFPRIFRREMRSMEMADPCDILGETRGALEQYL